MKQYTSKFLKIVAAFFMVFPVTYILAAAMVFDIPLNACARILLSPSYYVVTLCAVGAGYALWEMRRWSWYLLILSQILIGYEDAVIVSNYAETHHKIIAFLFSILVQVVIIYRVAREIRVPYFFPRIRWWESNPRYRLSLPVKIIRNNQQIVEGEILDLSMAGTFIKLRFDLSPDESVILKFKAYGHEIQCEGKAVWAAQSAVTHPKGVGIKFGVLSKAQKRSLRSVGRRLRKISSHYRRSRYLMSPEDFVKQLEEIESSTHERSH